MAADSSAANAWVDSYLDALLSYGLSSEYLKTTKEAEAKAKVPDADRSLYSRYYVQSLLKLDEEALHSAWAKASSSKVGGEKDVRLQFLAWRIWEMKRRHDSVRRDRRAAAEEELMSPTAYSSDEEAEEYMRVGYAEQRKEKADAAAAAKPALDASPFSQEAGGQPGGQPEGEGGAAEALPKPRQLQVKIGGAEALAGSQLDTVFEELHAGIASPGDLTPRAPLEHRADRLYVVLISLHGLVRGDKMELGRDSDTGGQVKYVVELAKALALHPSVYRVDLLTRLIKDPSVDASYGEPEECLVKGRGELGGAYIVRLPCGPTHQYVRKELLWAHTREFADRGIAHASATLAAMAEAGRRCELYAVHGHYADAGEVAVLMSSTLDVHMVMTGHSLGRNKLEHLLASGTMTRHEIEEAYAIGRRIEAEERCLDTAALVFTSTRQEVDEQWGLYDGYSPQLSRVLRFHRPLGRHMPTMKVIPPGLDFSSLKVAMPEDPTLREFQQARAAQDLMESRAAQWGATQPPSPLGPGSGAASATASPRPSGGRPAPGGEAGEGGVAAVTSPTATAPPTPLLTGTGTASGQTSPRGGAAATGAEGASAPPTPRPTADMMLDPTGGPPIWKEIARFLRNPLKPAVLAMSRPDPKKNLTTLVEAFGRHAMLRELANLVLVMGNRDNIDGMPSGTQKVLTQVLKLVDAHDLYGSVAYPKHHTQADISDIYLFPHATRGVFVNIALQEPFGLTVIEAAAHGVPTVATKNGGPVDIMATLHHGCVVDPTDPDAVAAALLRILTAPQTWDEMSSSGVKNIMAYSWPSHCKKYLEAIEAEKRLLRSTRRHDRTLSGLLSKRPAAPMAEPGALAHLEAAGETAAAATLGGLVHGVHGTPGADTMTRYFSTPSAAQMELVGGPMASGPTAGVRKAGSGVSADDLALLTTMDAEGLLRAGGPATSDTPAVAARRRRLVVLPLDSDYVVPQAAAALRALLDGLEAAGRRQEVGVGLLSMLGFDSTCQHLEAEGIPCTALDFLVCNSGADVWLQYDAPSGSGGAGRWESDEAYEGQIGFEWDRVALHRMLTKIISRPQADNRARRLPRLKELLYNVQEQPAAGVHPRHVCLELDPETQAILAAGMGPRSRGAHPAARTPALVDRLRRRLRSKGMRASYNLQMVPRPGAPSADESLLSVLHITPLRASRPLALRYLAQKLGLPLDAWVVMALAPETSGQGDSIVAGAYCSDSPDLVGGAQRVCVAVPDADAAAALPSPPGLLARTLGVHLSAYLEGTERVVVAPQGQASEAVLQLLAQAPGEAAAAK